MNGRSLGRRGLLKVFFALLVGGMGTGAFADAAHADSAVSGVVAGACAGGSVGRDVSVSYSTNAAFTTGVRFHVVSGTPDGPIIETLTRPLQGPASTSVSFSLPAGTYYFDWEDLSGDGLTWSGRHSALGDFYRSIYLSTVIEVATCEAVVVETTSTTTSIVAPTIPPTGPTATPADVPTPTPTLAPVIPPVGPTTPTTPGSTTIVAPIIPPSGPTAPTTPTTPTTAPRVPPTATAASTVASTPGLVVVGAETAPLLAAGAAFLGVGAIALMAARRLPSRRT